jgi:hypothetical protein
MLKYAYIAIHTCSSWQKNFPPDSGSTSSNILVWNKINLEILSKICITTLCAEEKLFALICQIGTQRFAFGTDFLPFFLVGVLCDEHVQRGEVMY